VGAAWARMTPGTLAPSTLPAIQLSQDAPHAMADKNESSVLFSLNELMNIEEGRIADEESARAAREAAEKARTDAEARARREAEELRLRAAEDARRADELRRREEEARVDAARQAEIDRARHDMEHKARLEQMAQAQAHEAQMAALKQDVGKKKLRMAVIGTGAALVLVAVGGFVIYRNNAAESERQLVALQAQLQAAQDEAEKRVRQAEEQLKNNASMSEAQKSALQAELEAAKRDALKNQAELDKTGGGKASRGGGGSRPAATKKPSGPACDPNDPMCGGL